MLHALTDEEGRRREVLLSPGNGNDLAKALPFLSRAARCAA
jgi:transposase